MANKETFAEFEALQAEVTRLCEQAGDEVGGIAANPEVRAAILRLVVNGWRPGPVS